MNKIIASALLGATLLGGSAIAQNAPQPARDAPREHRDPMLRGDANKDGIVTRSEMLARVEARFERRDANKDRKITEDERKQSGRRMGNRMGKRSGGPDGQPSMMRRGTGPGKDGVITLAESRAQATRVFDYVDRNADGRIDQAERQQVREVMRAFGGRDGNRGHGGRHRQHGSHHGGDAGAPNPAAKPGPQK